MSIFSDIVSVLDDVVSLILLRSCIICGAPIDEDSVCKACKNRIPLTHFAGEEDNAIEIHLKNLIPIEHAASLYWYVGIPEWKSIIYNFKYYGRWAMARRMGKWLGEELRKGGRYDDVDVIIAVPLHVERRLMRSYNQSEQLALGVSSVLDIPCDFKAIRRVQYNESQTRKRRSERWDNVSEIFSVRSPERLRGRHVLIVDDVLTTGATIISCTQRIVEACEGDVRISIATLAVSHRLFEYTYNPVFKKI